MRHYSGNLSTKGGAPSPAQPAQPAQIAVDNRTQRHALISPTTGQVYLRFPYDARLLRDIKDTLPSASYIEGTQDSAIPIDGRPLTASAKAMLYRLGNPIEHTGSALLMEQLIQRWGFFASSQTWAALNAAHEARQNIVEFGSAKPSEAANVFGQATLMQKEVDQEEDQARQTTQANGQPDPHRIPEIRGISGRDPKTANQITALKIQIPRDTDDSDQISGAPVNAYRQIKDPDGIYDTLMAYPGSQWVKGKKGQYRGYFRVTVTHDTPAMITELRRKHALLLDPTLPRPIAQRIDALHRDLKLSRATGAELTLPVPKGLDYLPYQKAGIAYAVRKGNALIADEPGLGKTIQAIGVSNTTPKARKILIVTPASLKINWAREWRKWCVKGLSIGEVAGGKPGDWPVTDTGHTPDVVIINFDLAQQHHKRLTDTPWDLMIVDEAHALKNDQTKRTKLILGDGAKSAGIPRHRTLLLTGTPILNRPKEIWTLAHALDPDYFNNKLRFALRYCNAHQTDHGWNMDGASNLKELQRELRARIMVRRRKADVLKDLPPKTRQVIPLSNDTITRRERHVIQKAADKLADIRQQRDTLEADYHASDRQSERDAQTYNEEVARLQDMEKIVFERLSLVRKETAIAKIPQVMELVEQGLEAGGKLILFAHHKEVIEAYTIALNDYFQRKAQATGRGRYKRPSTPPSTIAVVSGATKTNDRQPQADKFQDDPNCRVFLGSIGAAGVGLTLTKASLVIFGELDWVPGNVSQAEDRAHRLGQLGNVLVWHAVVDGSIDARMARRLVEKQAVLDSALDDDTGTQAPQPNRETQPKQVSDAERAFQEYLNYLDQAC